MLDIYPVIRTHSHSEVQETIRQNRADDLEYLTFPALSDIGFVKHLFTTRFGGVSEGDCASMNLSFTRGDDPEAVLENYRRVCMVLGMEREELVASMQTHTVNIRCATAEDKGKGIVRPLDYQDVDGLVTDEPGLGLVCFFADCVPLYFVDPVHRAIGLAHSGWKGTRNRMGAHMLQALKEHYGSKPEDIVAAIGPSICRACYEVSEDVAEQFQEEFPGTEVVTPGNAFGKYQLDLWLANQLILEQAGVLPEHISVTDLCTCHNPKYLFSHRASHGRRGNLAAFLAIRKE